jgi:S1-C subfamily serine protease
MSIHQYLCPTCGVALESARDVAGRKVRCLGCQTVFVAQSGDAPTPKPTTIREVSQSPPARARRPRPQPERPALPPIPARRRVPVAPFVVGAAIALAIGLTIFLVARYKDRFKDEDKPVAQKNEPPKPAAPKSNDTKPAPATTTDEPRTRAPEEEEEGAVLPTINPAKDNKPSPTPFSPKTPDLGSILPKLPGPHGPTGKSGETSPPAAKPKESKVDSDPPTRADGQIPAALLTKLKAATVFIKVRAGGFEGTGSGFVLRVDGDTALIVTNEHVAVPPAKLGITRRAEHELVFHSGRKNEFTRRGELIAADEDHDLAILKVTGTKGPDFPAPLNTTDRVTVTETMPVYMLGFPFGEMLSATKGNPGVTIGKGTVSSVREDDAGDAAYIQIDGDVNPGNSGGPVVDGRGRLVGVTVAKLRGTNIGMAIPPVELTRMLTGRVGNLEFRVNRVIRDTVEMDVRGDLIDPLERVSSASLRVVRADDLKKKPVVGADGKWSALEGSEKTDLKVSGRSVSCRVDLPLRARDRGQIEILFQPCCVDHDGKTHYFAPVAQTLKITEGGPGGGVPGPGFPMPPGGGFPMPPGGAPPGGGVGPPGGAPPAPPPLPPGPGGPPRQPVIPPRK